jgi:hypothetical protein
VGAALKDRCSIAVTPIGNLTIDIENSYATIEPDLSWSAEGHQRKCEHSAALECTFLCWASAAEQLAD